MKEAGAIVLGGAVLIALVLMVKRAQAGTAAVAAPASAGSIDAGAQAAFLNAQGYVPTVGGSLSPADALAAGIIPL